MMTRQDHSFLSVARAFATRANCSHRNVGAVVVSDGCIIGHGYNKGPDYKITCIQGGCPRGLLPPGEGKQDYSDCITVHAEVAALLMAGTFAAQGATLYVNSEPCFMCYRIAEGAGITRVVWQSDGEHQLHERHLGKP